jgi:AcrR family transcriptional regulator
MLRGTPRTGKREIPQENERSCYFGDVGKGEATRETILRHAVGMASRVGLSGLSIGRLAQELDLSKSGLFSHFHSKEALELQVLEYGAGRFVESVVKPALAAPRGVGRIAALFDRWLAWSQSDPSSGGCFFVAMSTDLDDRPGPTRDLLVRLQRSWMDLLAELVRASVREGHFRPDTDAEQFANDMYGVMLAYHHASRLLDDPAAEERARRALSALVDARRTADS